MARKRTPSVPDCRRALWLLGLTAPVSREDVVRAWRDRVGQSHPDRHLGNQAREQAAATLTRGLNDARETLDWWIDEERDWPPGKSGPRTVRFDEAEQWPEPTPKPEAAPVCVVTGLRMGDQVRLWPFDGDVLTVLGTEKDLRDRSTWVRLLDHPEVVKADRVRLSAFSCPTCGACSGPVIATSALRPCPLCLLDLRLLERSAAEAPRIRRAIEARAQAGEAEAEAIGDGRYADRARERRRWARRLILAGPDDLHAALLGAFSRAWERWGEDSRDDTDV